MIYKKPKSLADPRADDRAILNFIDSLPDSFEIVEPGMTQVRWPEGLTKETLTRLADKISQQLNAWEFWHAQSAALYALAAIAPEEKKARKVALWERVTDKRRQWTDADCIPADDLANWRKVGECEVME